ncbi:hypothetical protein DQ04_00491210 [Trypanosoma grayi]|uniref:hypothetical protein n=1 Tax=Trypanosoma grayi TaxID=71804 RepID=UPI0004F3F6AA|nr:hypothetical protein DQ04_00491210 [Trypanosoma grayi]KEG14401.1 hypothetical protein DQ04_00491210 [Trypanosoma grayi]
MPVSCGDRATRKCPRKAATPTSAQKFFEKTTAQDTYKWPKLTKNYFGTVVNLNTQPSQVECLLHPNKVGEKASTTYEQGFVRHKVQPRSQTAPASQLERHVEGRTEKSTTTYEDMHSLVTRAIRRHEVERVPLMRPVEPKWRVSVFEGISEYKESFPKLKIVTDPVSPRRACVHTFPFRGTSTMKKDYTFKRPIPCTPIPKTKARLMPETRDFRTTYRSSHRKPPYPELSPFAVCIRPWAFKRN